MAFAISLQRCHRCELTIDSKGFAMITNRMGPSACFHTGCFTCATCKELLVDNIYFFRTGDIYCGRHYAELVYPRCSACDEVGVCSLLILQKYLSRIWKGLCSHSNMWASCSSIRKFCDEGGKKGASLFNGHTSSLILLIRRIVVSKK